MAPGRQACSHGLVIASRGMSFRSLRCLPVLIACASCAQTPEATAPSSPPATASASATAAPQAVEVASASSVPPRPLDLINGCPKEMHLYYGDHPGDGQGAAATAAAGATIAIPRRSDGTAVVWVVDDKGSGLASLQVTRRMRHVRINADCMRMDADSAR
jgi:hypothetical protein